jgi:hypothetical protein
VLRHVSISPDPKAASQQLGENARDANRALVFAISGYYREVRGYGAVGTSDARISIPGGNATAVLCVRVHESGDPGGNVQVPAALNFGVTHGALSVCEPSGLVANTLYDLTFLVLE